MNPDGGQLALTGFKAGNRKRLKSLDGGRLETLVQTEKLELLHIHLLSMQKFRSMAERISSPTEGSETAEASEKETAAAKSKKKK